MKLRKPKKGQPKGWKDDAEFGVSAGVPVMEVGLSGVPSGAVATADRVVPGDPAAVADEGADEAVAPDADAMAPEADLEERSALVETMYQAAHARVAAAESRELAAEERLVEALEAERTAAERLADADARERTAAERLADADARERAAIERLAAAEGRERAIAERLAATEARERTAAERDAIANQRDRAAAERDAIANDRDRATADRAGRIDARLPAAAPAPDSGDPALEVARLEAELQRAHLDALTGALRREMGRVILRNEIERARRGDGRFVIAFIDVDGLKAVNDREGHAAGDRVLRTLSATLRANLRSYDPIVRYGGDEFVCGISAIDPDEVHHRIALIDQSLRRATGAGVSAGLARLGDGDGDALEELIARADAALLEAKRSRPE